MSTVNLKKWFSPLLCLNSHSHAFCSHSHPILIEW